MVEVIDEGSDGGSLRLNLDKPSGRTPQVGTQMDADRHRPLSQARL